MSIQLNTFIAETLQGIVEGIVAAQQKLEGQNTTVNPLNVASPSKNISIVSYASQQATVQLIDFELSLAETGSNQAGARIGVIFSSIGLGAGAKTEATTSAVNKVKFSVPIIFPSYEWKPS